MKNKVKKKMLLAWVLGLVVVLTSVVYSHCQIPCGIYGDAARFDMIAEHITTIEKSIKQITELSNQQKPNLNQIVRWTNNKDNHADKLSHILTYYFLAQRIKPTPKTDSAEYDKYIKKLTLLHQMISYSMKTKQTTDLANTQKLRDLSAQFKAVYFE